MHDVASVLLLVVGELPAYATLTRVAAGPLRDATRPTLDPVLELLGLMGPILEASDNHVWEVVWGRGWCLLALTRL